MKIIVGYSGFVGSNIIKQEKFDAVFNSINIDKAYGMKPDLLVYAGIRAEMFLANNDPEADLYNINEAINNIAKICPKKLILISTVSVYSQQQGENEQFIIQEDQLTVYGKNRLFLEKWVEENIDDYLIVRLPALFGENLKKNFIYDYIHFIPQLLTSDKFIELSQKEIHLKEYYEEKGHGFYKCKELTEERKEQLKGYFEKVGFSALNFTDSRNTYQFYNLERLWSDIKLCLSVEVKKVNLVTEPISVAELYGYLSDDEFVNELSKSLIKYDLRTVHSELFNGADGYICNKATVLQEIKAFVERKI